MSEDVSIYADADKMICLKHTRLYYRNLSITTSLIDVLPNHSKDTVTIIVTENQDILAKINADHFNFLILIVPEKIMISLNFHLYNAIVYKYKENESHQIATEEILVSLISFIFDRDYSLDLQDVKKILCFKKGQYLNIDYNSIKVRYLDQAVYGSLQHDTSLIIHMNLKLLTLDKIESIVDMVVENLKDEYLGDIFWEGKACGDILSEEFFVLYAVAD